MITVQCWVFASCFRESMTVYAVVESRPGEYWISDDDRGEKEEKEEKEDDD